MGDAIASRPRSDTPPFPVLLRPVLLAGLVAGVVAGLYSLLVVEPVIRAALRVEGARPTEPGAVAEEPLVSYPVQVLGGILAAVLAALAIAALFAIAYARLRATLPGGSDFGRCVTLAVAGFVATALLPAIKYPANPPAVGDTETVASRTWFYVSFLLATILVTAALWVLRRRLPPAWSAPLRATVLTVLTVAAFALLLAVWPAPPDPIPADVPAALIWRFRVSSLGQLGCLWGSLGLVAGLLLERRAVGARFSAARSS